METKGKNDLLFTSHQQVVSSNFLGSKDSVCTAVACEDEHLDN